jgi:ketosteroid isomerase-like protein
VSDQQRVIAAAERRAAALAAGDAEELRTLLHPDFAWTSHTGRHFDREAYLDANIGGPTRWHGQRLCDVAVAVAGDTAVLRCVVEDEVTRDGARTVFRMPVTQTWVRTVTGWRCLAGHAGPAERTSRPDRSGTGGG